MEQNTRPDGVEHSKVDQPGLEQAPESEDGGRRSFLARAAIGVAGTAGLMAIGAQAAQASDTGKATIKRKILDRIKVQMAAQDPGLEEGGGDAYIKNSHSLYLKQ